MGDDLSAGAAAGVGGVAGAPWLLQQPAATPPPWPFSEVVDSVFAEARRLLVAEHARIMLEGRLNVRFPDRVTSPAFGSRVTSPVEESCGEEREDISTHFWSETSVPSQPTRMAGKGTKASGASIAEHVQSANSTAMAANSSVMAANSTVMTPRKGDGMCNLSTDRWTKTNDGLCTAPSSVTTMTLEEVIELGCLGRRLEKRTAFRERIMYDRTYQHSLVETCMAAMVILNITLIGVSSDVAYGWVGWTVIDAMFALIFTIECVLKVIALGCRHYFCGHDRRWNVTEASLALLAAIEVVLSFVNNSQETHLSALRIVRLVRIARVVRICRLEAFCDLLMMINGAVGGVRTLLWSIILISVPLYAVALLLRETIGRLEWPDEPSLANAVGSDAGGVASSRVLLAGNESYTDGLFTTNEAAVRTAAEAFSSLPWSFFSVFRCVVGQDCTGADGKPLFVHLTKTYGWLYGAIYCITMLLMTFGLFNVIVAIYVENTVAAAKFNDLKLKRHRMQNQQLVAEKLHELVEITCEHWDRRESMANKHSSTGSIQMRLSVFYDDQSHDRTTLKKTLLKLADEISITPPFMDDLRNDPRVVDIFKALDIASEDTQDLFDTLDVDGGGTIDIKEMILGLCKLRGDASRSDIVGVKLVVRNIQTQINGISDAFQRLADIQQDQIQAISGLLAPGEPQGGGPGFLGGGGGAGGANRSGIEATKRQFNQSAIMKASDSESFPPLRWSGRRGWVPLQQKAETTDEEGFGGIRSV